MTEQIYLYDNSFEGLLTAVALAVKAAKPIHGIFSEKNYFPSLFATIERIESESEQAERLFRYLRELSRDAASLAIQAFLSEDSKIGCYLLDFVRLCLVSGSEVLNLHSDDSVRALLDLSRKVKCEADRLNGMLRFRMLADGLLYAPLRADHNVIGYCAGHFRHRFANRRWILHDLGRDFALYWDGVKLQSVEIDREMSAYVGRFGELPEDELTDSERSYQELWRSFHAATANPERENRALQRRFMPYRYWHFMVEMKS